MDRSTPIAVGYVVLFPRFISLEKGQQITGVFNQCFPEFLFYSSAARAVFQF